MTEFKPTRSERGATDIIERAEALGYRVNGESRRPDYLGRFHDRIMRFDVAGYRLRFINPDTREAFTLGSRSTYVYRYDPKRHGDLDASAKKFATYNGAAVIAELEERARSHRISRDGEP